MALRLVGVVLSANVGVPVTIATSLVATTMVMRSPALYVPFAVVDVTPVTVGAVVSTVIASSVEVAVLPEESVSVTEMVQSPFPRVANVQLPAESVQVTLVDPAFVAVKTADPAKLPLTVNVGVLSDVMLSVANTPRSEAVARSGAAGVAMAVALTTTFANGLDETESTPLIVCLTAIE